MFHTLFDRLSPWKLTILRLASLSILAVGSSCIRERLVEARLTPGPAVMDILGGDGQSGPPGQELPTALTVLVKDDAAAIIAGQPVNFVVVKGGGRVFAGGNITNSQGIAKERWTLGNIVGDEQVVEVRAVDNATGVGKVFARFTATVSGGTAASLVISRGNGQSAGMGSRCLIPSSCASSTNSGTAFRT